MFLDFGNIEGLNDEELYILINKKSNYSLTSTKIKEIINTINAQKKEIDKKRKKEGVQNEKINEK